MYNSTTIAAVRLDCTIPSVPDFPFMERKVNNVIRGYWPTPTTGLSYECPLLPREEGVLRVISMYKRNDPETNSSPSSIGMTGDTHDRSGSLYVSSRSRVPLTHEHCVPTSHALCHLSKLRDFPLSAGNILANLGFLKR